LFKEKKLFSSTQTIIHQFFSLFKKWKKRKNKHIIQEDARPFQKKQKQKLIEQKHPNNIYKHANKNLLELKNF